MYDLLLTGGRVVDPAGGVDAQMDVAIADGRIAAVEAAIPTSTAREVLPVGGRAVIPGVIDTHVHLSRRFGGANGHRMVARTGVTTALDLAGDVDDIAGGLRDAGAGLSVAYLFPLIPKDTDSSEAPPESELARVIDQGLARGALGIKLLGGHHPLTPEATAAAMRLSVDRGACLAFHVGTTVTGSDIRGLEEAIGLAGGRPIHLAHINSYCRGQVLEAPVEEAQRAIALLGGATNVISESYLSLLNGTTGRCVDGQPASHVTRTCLRLRGYPPTEAGLEQAIRDGYTQVQQAGAGDTTLLTGAEGVRLWRERETNVGISFPVNSPQSQFLLATARRNDRFVVDAISTDGGAIPRNVLITGGLALVRFGALSLREFVVKASVNPARMLGISTKGHLKPGADGDVTVLNLEKGRAVAAIAGGRVIMLNGTVVGAGGTLLTGAWGEEEVRRTGLPCRVIRG